MEIERNIIEKVELLNVARKEAKKVIVCQNRVLGMLLICLLCDAHILLEGILGLAKTLMINTLASTIDAKFSRIQFPPDLLSSDFVISAMRFRMLP